MDAFRKSPSVTLYSPSPSARKVVQFVKSVKANNTLSRGSRKVSSTFLEKREISPSELADTLVLPTAEEYSLENMLASGVPLKEVSTSGLIQSDAIPSEEHVNELIDKVTSLGSKQSISVSSSSDMSSDPQPNN